MCADTYPLEFVEAGTALIDGIPYTRAEIFDMYNNADCCGSQCTVEIEDCPVCRPQVHDYYDKFVSFSGEVLPGLITTTKHYFETDRITTTFSGPQFEALTNTTSFTFTNPLKISEIYVKDQGETLMWIYDDFPVTVPGLIEDLPIMTRTIIPAAFLGCSSSFRETLVHQYSLYKSTEQRDANCAVLKLAGVAEDVGDKICKLSITFKISECY